MNAPRIGISTYVEPATWGIWNREAALLPTTYINLVVAAGGTPVLLPPAPGCEAAALDGVDALIVAGGPDVDPSRYGAAAHPTTGHPRVPRDAHELQLLALARQRRLPALAVCRGMQLLNVLYGGTLHQHLPEVIDSTAHQPFLGVFGSVQARVRSGSQLAGVVGAELPVHCHHHQAIDRVGPGLVVTATADDGTVEAVEDPEQPFLLGVQWHPEENPDERRLFEALRQAAQNRVSPAHD